jgi:hypothetical protein
MSNAKAAAALAEHAEAIRMLGKRAIADIIEIGRRLIEAKKLCGHGNWLPWLEREFGWKERTAQRFMTIATKLASNASDLTDLDLPVEALYRLAAPSTPPAVIDAVVERGARGDKVTASEVRTLVAQSSARDRASPSDHH